MTSLAESNDIQIEQRQPGTWGAAFQVGLPHLLMGLLVGLGRLGVFDVLQLSRTGYLVVGIGLALLVAGVLLQAWRRGWPESRGQIETVWQNLELSRGVVVPISLLLRLWGSPCCRAAPQGWRHGVRSRSLGGMCRTFHSDPDSDIRAIGW